MCRVSTQTDFYSFITKLCPFDLSFRRHSGKRCFQNCFSATIPWRHDSHSQVPWMKVWVRRLDGWSPRWFGCPTLIHSDWLSHGPIPWWNPETWVSDLPLNVQSLPFKQMSVGLQAGEHISFDSLIAIVIYEIVFLEVFSSLLPAQILDAVLRKLLPLAF